MASNEETKRHLKALTVARDDVWRAHCVRGFDHDAAITYFEAMAAELARLRAEHADLTKDYGAMVTRAFEAEEDAKSLRTESMRGAVEALDSLRTEAIKRGYLTYPMRELLNDTLRAAEQQAASQGPPACRASQTAAMRGEKLK